MTRAPDGMNTVHKYFHHSLSFKKGSVQVLSVPYQTVMHYTVVFFNNRLGCRERGVA